MLNIETFMAVVLVIGALAGGLLTPVFFKSDSERIDADHVMCSVLLGVASALFVIFACVSFAEMKSEYDVKNYVNSSNVIELSNEDSNVFTEVQVEADKAKSFKDLPRLVDECNVTEENILKASKDVEPIGTDKNNNEIYVIKTIDDTYSIVKVNDGELVTSILFDRVIVYEEGQMKSYLNITFNK